MASNVRQLFNDKLKKGFEGSYIDLVEETSPHFPRGSEKNYNRL
jgi:hypothetical protein